MNSTVWPVACFLEVGNDFISDTPVDLGGLIMASLTEKLAETLDFVVANGSSGSSQPTGLGNATGVTSVAATNGTSGPLTVSDLELLFFGLPKQYRVRGWNPAFVSSDTMYRRARAIATGISGDQTRVFGLTHGDYQCLGWPWLIQNDIAQGTIYFAAMRSYRLYRRAGISLKWTAEGETLTRKNTRLLTMRARYAGRPTLGECIAKMTNAAQTG
jgi:HK97 family phage major capsid protein